MDADLEGIVFDIQQLVSQFIQVIFVFAPLRCNQAAHARSLVSFLDRRGSHVWDYVGTEWLFNILTVDVNLSIRF